MILSKKKKSQANSLVSSKLSCQIFGDQETTVENKIQEMQKKMIKIMNAYTNLKKQFKQKDQKIQQLERQNQQLKVKISQHTCQNFLKRQQNINSYSTLKTKDFDLSNRTNNFYIQKNNFQNFQKEKFIKNELKQYSTIRVHKSLSPKIHFKINGKKQINNQEFFRSREQIFDKEKQLNSNSIKKNIKTPEYHINQNITNKIIQSQTQEDLQFSQTLQKLKQKIHKYEQQEGQNNGKNEQSKILKQVKSTQNLNRTHSKINSQVLNFKIESHQNKNEQLSKLKQIWNERDKEIKKMDDLFANIDKRLNAQRG